jgi:hypothetical protein
MMELPHFGENAVAFIKYIRKSVQEFVEISELI